MHRWDARDYYITSEEWKFSYPFYFGLQSPINPIILHKGHQIHWHLDQQTLFLSFYLKYIFNISFTHLTINYKISISPPWKRKNINQNHKLRNLGEPGIFIRVCGQSTWSKHWMKNSKNTIKINQGETWKKRVLREGMEGLSAAKEEERTVTFYAYHPCYFLEEALRALLRCLGVESSTSGSNNMGSQSQMKEEEENSSQSKPPSCACHSVVTSDKSPSSSSSSSSSHKSSQEAADPVVPSTTTTHSLVYIC